MKVSTAKICLNCDAVYEGDLCPDCAGRGFICLSRYFKPQYESRTLQNRNPIIEESGIMRVKKCFK